MNSVQPRKDRTDLVTNCTFLFFASFEQIGGWKPPPSEDQHLKSNIRSPSNDWWPHPSQDLWIQKEEDLFVFTVTVAVVLSDLLDIRMPWKPPAIWLSWVLVWMNAGTARIIVMTSARHHKQGVLSRSHDHTNSTFHPLSTPNTQPIRWPSLKDQTGPTALAVPDH